MSDELIGALGGTFLGGAIGLVTALKIADKEDRSARRRELLGKLEEIHDAAGRVRRITASSHARVMRFVVNGTPYEKGEAPPHDRLDTLVRMYAKSLEKEYERMHVVGRAQNLLVLDTLGEPPPSDPTKRDALAREIDRLTKELDSTYADLQSGVAKLAQNLLG